MYKYTHTHTHTLNVDILIQSHLFIHAHAYTYDNGVYKDDKTLNADPESTYPSIPFHHTAVQPPPPPLPPKLPRYDGSRE